MYADGQAAVVLLETCVKHTHAPQAWMRVQPGFCWGWGLAPLQAIKISGHNTQPSMLQYTATIKFLCVSGTINESEKWDGHSAYTGYSDGQLWRWEMQPQENKREQRESTEHRPVLEGFLLSYKTQKSILRAFHSFHHIQAEKCKHLKICLMISESIFVLLLCP